MVRSRVLPLFVLFFLATTGMLALWTPFGVDQAIFVYGHAWQHLPRRHRERLPHELISAEQEPWRWRQIRKRYRPENRLGQGQWFRLRRVQQATLRCVARNSPWLCYHPGSCKPVDLRAASGIEEGSCRSVEPRPRGEVSR